MTTQWLAGVDGCRAGWIAALVDPDHGDVRVRILSRFADIFAEPEQPRIVAIDVPIGLPSRVGPRGRGPERAVRPLLGGRQSSVFTVPSRRAVYAKITKRRAVSPRKHRIRRKKYPNSSS